MTKKEFIQKVEELGLRANCWYDEYIYVFDRLARPVASVSEENYAQINTGYIGLTKMKNNVRKKLLGILTEYSLTPLEEREEPKKYYLRLPNLFGSEKVYLNYWVEGNEYFFDCKENSKVDKTQFTQEEIDNLPNQEFFQSLIKEEVK